MYKKCNECNRERRVVDKGQQICLICYKIKTMLKSSGNKVIDDFIRYTQSDYSIMVGGKMEFIPYEQFNNIEFIAEGGFSKIYKATWVDGPIEWYFFKRSADYIFRKNYYMVALKKLNNSKNITSKELNELKLFYQIVSNSYTTSYVCEYFGITQEPVNKDIIIVMPYYNSGDLMHYLSNDFYNISWFIKLCRLYNIIVGLKNIHEAKIIHRDLHSGNIFFSKHFACIGDLGISKSATEFTDNNENYGIIPYMAPEIFQGQKYTEASDVYSFGMIMWEFMTGRRPFWNENHDTELIINICDGLRPPIVTNAPEGYIELMKDCWHSDPKKRPSAIVIYWKLNKMRDTERKNTATKIMESSDIGPVTINNPGAIYKSRPLSHLIQSAMSLRSLRNQAIDPFYYYCMENNESFTDKRKFEVDLVDKNNNKDNGQSIKRRKFFGEINNDYFTKEIELDININSNQPNNNGYISYITKEIELDINAL
ncbi:kinase-like domain-containing protein [Rhizophagus irregularis DAOM 181602=DAOM 197198]|uniref:Ypk2p n=3 Tax=Rhizophagus irregularis TaxID=588596 RepID=A0A015NAX7_RHIIW|nr:Ypk2p [Rhizophagus irregularis DAOM 197198w]GBC26794.2 kinase-like domain-containing protein [Rhizophagus irregularis DAOM 181602=DAOM 197198]